MSKRRRNSWIAAVAALAVTLWLGGCGGGATSGPRKLVLGIKQEPDKLNSALNAMVYGVYICHAIYGYLLTYNDKMELVPDVATEVPTLENGGISANSLTYTYHLRRGVKWHDGQPFTAADVLFSIDVIMNPLHEIETRAGYDKIDRAEAPDDHTVVLHLREPFAPLLQTVFVGQPIVARHLLASQVGEGFSKAKYHRKPIGFGPFKLVEWVSGSHVRLSRYDDYHHGRAGLSEIVIRFIGDNNTLLVELQSRGIHGYDNAETKQLGQLQKIPGVQLTVTPSLMWEHLDLNTTDAILSDVRVRQAIQHAVDREQISKQVYDGVLPPAHGDVSPRLPWYNPEVVALTGHDLAKSRQLLEEAGWKLEEGGAIRTRDGQPLKLSISTTSGAPLREMTEGVLRQQLREVGIDLAIQNHNATALFAPFQSNGVLKRGNFQLGMYAWISMPDPDRWSFYHSTQLPDRGGQNHPRFQNAQLDELLERGQRTLAASERKPIYDQVQRIVATEVPMVSLVWRSDLDAMPVDLEGFKPNPTSVGDTWNIHEWRWKEK